LGKKGRDLSAFFIADYQSIKPALLNILQEQAIPDVSQSLKFLKNSLLFLTIPVI
jgi:hypothetical protein